MKFTPPPVLIYFNIVKNIWLSTYSRRTVSISRGTRERNRNTPLDAPIPARLIFPLYLLSCGVTTYQKANTMV